MLDDLRHAARRLRTQPAFTLLAVLTLALGIGSSTAIFSAVNPVLFEPLPYPHADRVVALWDRTADFPRIRLTFGTYRELVARNRTFDAIAVMKGWEPTMTSATEPERFEGMSVTADYFRALGVAPVLGQDFRAADDRPAGARVAILGDALWRRRFAADPGIIGRAITLDDALYTVIGVMPDSFENVLYPHAQIWTLLQYDPAIPAGGREWGHHLRAVGRVRAGVRLDEARRDLDAIAKTPVAEFTRPRWASMQNGLIVQSLQDDVTAGVRPAMLAVLGAVILVLAIACVNVTNLLLARGAQRRGEMAMRAALGAGRARLMRHLLAESLLLSLLAGACALAIAQFGVQTLIAFTPPGLPRVHAIRVDATVFFFALAVTTLVGLAVGVMPAWYAARVDLQAGVRQGSRQATRGHHLARRALVIAEVALALVLLVSAGLLLRSLQRLFAVAPGFEAADVLTMQVQTSGQRFNRETTHRFFDEALDHVRAIPGVRAAAYTSQLPLSGDFDAYGVHFESSPLDRPEENHGAFRYAISPGYFDTMRTPLRRGRLLDGRDDAHAPLAVLINESFAKRKFGDMDPLGQRLRIGPADSPFHTIVGIVADVKQTSLALGADDAVYVTTAQWRFTDDALTLVVRAREGIDVTTLTPQIKQAIWAVDKDQPIARIATMESLLAASAAERRFALMLFETFALAALALAAIGIYGVLSGSVTERLREIGIRSALGASRGSLLTLVVRQGMMLTGLGVLIGLSGAAMASGALVTLLFGVSRLDPITYAGVFALLLAVSAIACWIPAWRAARVDPSITLRAE